MAKGELLLLAGLNSPRLSVYAAVLIVTIGIVQLAASLLLYRTIDQHTLREDHARRVAELLVVSDRVYRLEGRLTPSVMSSRHLQVALAAAPLTPQPSQNEQLRQIAEQIVQWEPSLAGKPLYLAIAPAGSGREDLVGSMRLGEGLWLNFKSRDISSMWPIALRATWMTLVTALACLGVGLGAIRLLTKPLRRLSEAAGAIGEGRRVVIREDGPADLRNLAQAMNEMQDRIARLLEDQAKSFEAISHDLRTPLSRQKLAAELIDDAEVGEIVNANVDEMEALLQSLQQFLRAQHLSAEPEMVDINAALRGLTEAFSGRVRVISPAQACVHTYREPVLLSLQALIENARRFGERVEVTVEEMAGKWFIEIEDDGPGIPAQHFDDVLAPFFRLDAARGRTTQGFGLGIPTAHRLLTRFGGGLSFRTGAGGGLIVRVALPAG